MKILIDFAALVGSYSDSGEIPQFNNVSSLLPSSNAREVLESLCFNHEVSVLAKNDSLVKSWMDVHGLKYNAVLTSSNGSYNADLVLSPSVDFLNSCSSNYRVCISRVDNKQWHSGKVGSLREFEDVLVKPLSKQFYK